jgi:transcriptional regulator with XRE-family HTH domain
MDEPDEHQRFLDWLRDELKKPGRSQSGLARALGVHSSAINRMVKGERQIKIREISQIYQYLRGTGGTRLSPLVEYQRFLVSEGDVPPDYAGPLPPDGYSELSPDVKQFAAKILDLSPSDNLIIMLTLAESYIDIALDRCRADVTVEDINTLVVRDNPEDTYRAKVSLLHALRVIYTDERDALLSVGRLGAAARKAEGENVLSDPVLRQEYEATIRRLVPGTEIDPDREDLSSILYQMGCTSLCMVLVTGDRTKVANEFRSIADEIAASPTKTS